MEDISLSVLFAGSHFFVAGAFAKDSPHGEAEVGASNHDGEGHTDGHSS